MKSTLVASVVLLAAPQLVHAQEYPLKPVRLIIPWAAGGSTDSIGRILGQKLSEYTGQQWIIDNRGGATGTIGTALAAKAAPDGYTLLLGTNSTFAIAPHLYKTLQYDNDKALAPISLVAISPQILSVHPSLRVKTVKDIITLARVQAITYKERVLGEESTGAIGVVLGGDASCATGGFWAALTIATTQSLPMLFYIEDNGYGISVPSSYQTPGGNIAANLASFSGLTIFSGDGTEPAEAARLIEEAIGHVRGRKGPALIRLTVPRLEGHSFQDTQTYKSADEVKAEWARDPLPRLKTFAAELDWDFIEASVAQDVEAARAEAEGRGVSSPDRVTAHVFFEGEAAKVGGGAGLSLDGTTDVPAPEGQRINMVTAIRRVLDQELAANPKVLVFGEDVGPKGGVHAVTLGLQDKYGHDRVFDTSLNEEGIIGRAVGMALAGLMPVPEIQFRKYAEPATEQINDCGTMRWRTANRFSAPMVLRIPGGFFKCGDPWHSQTNEVQFVHNPGWKVAVPSNAEDAVGLLRASLRGHDPVIFFEHRAQLDESWARRPWPGDAFVLPFGVAKKTRLGDQITIVTWGAMVPRCEAAAEGISADVIDLRTLNPWDREAVLDSVRRTRRCLIVHEDLRTGGFGAEIAAVVADEAFLDLDAPVARVTMPDIPSPHHPSLLEWAVPSVERIRAEIDRLVGF